MRRPRCHSKKEDSSLGQVSGISCIGFPLARLAELGEVDGEDDWDEEFKDEERYRQTCSREGSEHENL